MDRRSWYEKVADEVASVGIVDAHEHVLGRRQRKKADPDLFDWIEDSSYYVVLLASGMSEGEFHSRGPDDGPRRWQVLRPHLKRTRTSPCALLIDLAFCDLFDFSFFSLNDDNWPEISEHIQAANQRDDWFEVVLGEKTGVEVGLLDWQFGGTLIRGLGHPGGWYDYILRIRPKEDDETVNSFTTMREIDTRFFRPVFKIDPLLYGYGHRCLSEIKRLFEVDADGVKTLDDYLSVVDRCFENIAARGAAGIKLAIAVLRSLHFPKTDRAAAEKALTLASEDLTVRDAQNFENYMVHVVVQKSIEHHLPFQIHTGTGFVGYSRDDNGRADHLFNLIAGYPEARFELLHGGFPYPGESATLAGRFPNVYLNSTWFTTLSPTEARRALSSWIEMVPMHKFTWGGDCIHVEETYGAFLLARRVVADALYDKIEDGWLDEATALEFVRGMFHDNALNLFALSTEGRAFPC